MLTALLLGALYVLGVLAMNVGSAYVAIGLLAGFCLALLIIIASALAGLVSYTAHQKEARRGALDHHRP